MIKCVLTIAIFLSAIFSYGQTFEHRYKMVIATDSGIYWLSDTVSAEWMLPKMKDTLAALKSLLNCYKRDLLDESIFLKKKGFRHKKGISNSDSLGQRM